MGHSPSPPPEPPSPVAVTPPDEHDLFLREMEGVQPLPSDARLTGHPPPPPADTLAVTHTDMEVLTELSELVSGSGHFDITNTTEFIEGTVVGLDRRVLRRLRNGEFAYQSHLDLHGMTAEEARSTLGQFLAVANSRGQRCVLIVHGRGLNSKDHVPVLKNRLATWLSRGHLSRSILAFASARPCDGGAGALYVLLRRRPQSKRAIRVTEGAKW